METKLTVMAAAALCSGCMIVSPAPVPHAHGPILFEAAGDLWRFTLFATGVRYVSDRPLREYWGTAPARRSARGAAVLSGEVSRDYAIGGLAEEDLIVYEMEVRPAPCRDASGRLHPSTVRLTLSADVIVGGSGGALPPAR